MVAIEKLNNLTVGQQKSLHESVAKFIEENLQEIKELSFVDEELLASYLAKVAPMRKELFVRSADHSLNDALFAIMIAAESRCNAVAQDCKEGAPDTMLLSRLIKHFTMLYHQMKHLDECLVLLHSLYSRESTDEKNSTTAKEGKLVQIVEFAAVAEASTTAKLEDDVVFVDYSLPGTRENWQLVQTLNELHITFGGQQYIANTGDFYIESSKDDLGEQNRFIGRIRISRLTSIAFVDKSDKAYFRYLIPIGSVDWYHDIHTYSAYIKNGWTSGLIELTDGETMLHVYPCNDGGKKYMVVESLTMTTNPKMAEYVYSVALTLGFITGTIHLGKCYEFSSSEVDFKANVSMAYHTMRPSSETGMRIFTTNMYYVREVLKSGKVALSDKKPLFNEKGEFQEHLQDWLQQDTVQSLFSLIHNDEKIARAVVTIIESANFPLEYQASVRAIVLETLAHSVPGPKPISDESLWKQIMTDLDAVVTKYVNNGTDGLQISPESQTILSKKIATMNNPTNADSLAQPLKNAGYTLTQNDKDALKMRNTFLHGGIVKGRLEEQTSEIFYLSLMLHKLACIIILKRADFSGYILNNPVLFNCAKAVDAGERVLLLI